MLNAADVMSRIQAAGRSGAELNPWMIMVDDTTVLDKDGGLLKVFAIDGMDAEGAEPWERDRQVRLLERAILQFDERISLWWTLERRRASEYPDGRFHHPASAAIDQLWKKAFAGSRQFCNRIYLSVLFRPVGGLEAMSLRAAQAQRQGKNILSSLLSSFGGFSHRVGFAELMADLDMRQRAFYELLDPFLGACAEMGIRPLIADDLLGFLHRRANPAAGVSGPVRAPDPPAFLDAWLSADEIIDHYGLLSFENTHTVWVGGVSIKGWPEWSYPGMLDALAGVPAELTVSQCFRFEDPKRAIKYIRAMESHHRALSKTLKTYIREILTREESGQANRQRLALSAEASEAAGDMGLGRVKFGWHNLTVLVYGYSQDAAEQNVQMAANALRRMGFVTIRERFHLLPAYAGTLPGQWMEPVRWHFLGTDNIADFAPIRAFFEGETTNPHYSTQSGRIESCLTVLPTEQATPFYFNFHQGDVGHTLVVGPTGSGKSVFCNFLMAQFRKYDPGFVFIFDKNQSCKIPTLLQGGTHIDLTGGHDIMLNPMALVGRKESWSWLAGWLEILLTSRGHQLSSDDEREVWKSIESISVLSPDLWRLRTLASFLPRHLQTELDPWIGDGPLARFFDNPQDTFDLGDFTCVEMSRVLDNPRTGLARAFMEYAFYRIDEKLDGRPALIYLEEAWFLMADERFAAKIEDWLKTLRKKNALVIMTTQSLDDVSRAGIAASILDNVKTRIFLPNPNAEAYRDLYQRGFGLLPGQVDRIREAMPKREYYIQTETVSRLVQVTFDAPLLAYLRSDVRAQRLFEQHRQSGDPQWQQRYLKDAASI